MTVEMMLNPGKYGLEMCQHCNGYGSSLKEASPICTRCGGSGLIPKKEAKEASFNLVGEGSLR